MNLIIIIIHLIIDIYCMAIPVNTIHIYNEM